MSSSNNEAFAASAFTTFGTPALPLLLAQNVPARVVIEILGHSQLAITTDLYSHVVPTALRRAADAMDRVFMQPN
jgi:integrase